MTFAGKIKAAARTVAAAAIFFMVFLMSYGAYADAPPEILFNGSAVASTAQPFIEDGTTLIPMRSVFSAMGAEVTWDDKSFSAAAKKDGTEIVFAPGKKALYKNGTEISLLKSPVIIDSTLFVPLRAVCESFGYTVSWDGEKNRINISSEKPLRAHFFDCGQADSTFLELPDGRCMLIDGGEKKFGKELCEKIRALGYEKIDIMVATHPHADHIGGLVTVLKNFKTDVFYMPNVTHTTKTFENLLDALSENGSECIYASRGTEVLTGDVKCRAVAPDGQKYERMNNYSIVLKVEYNDVSLLFAGDSEALSEYSMVNSGMDIKSDVLKVAHHGSATSSTEEFLQKVSPKAAVISVGRENQYGFPAPIVLNRLEALGTAVYRTDISGTINFETDGYVYKFK